MQKQVVLTEEEYNELLEKKKKIENNNQVTINKSEYDDLKAASYTLFAYSNPLMVCPKCKQAYLVSGYVCPCCGYDYSYDYDDDDF